MKCDCCNNPFFATCPCGVTDVCVVCHQCSMHCGLSNCNKEETAICLAVDLDCIKRVKPPEFYWVGFLQNWVAVGDEEDNNWYPIKQQLPSGWHSKGS